LTAFVGIETNQMIRDNHPSQTRYVPIQIAEGDAHLLSSSPIVHNQQQSGFLNTFMSAAGFQVISPKHRYFLARFHSADTLKRTP
jgi:mRNA degradation ribonuclease J1/J2